MSLIVYGVNCSWWDGIEKTANTGPGRTGIPICPHCGSVLFQMEEPEWWAAIERHRADGNPDYRAFAEWSRGRCFPDFPAAKAAYEAQRDG